MVFRPQEILEFLRYCLDDKSSLPSSSAKIEWMGMMTWAEQQAVVGVVYGGILKAGKSLNIPLDDLMEWIGYAQDIENQNRFVNNRCFRLVKTFSREGYQSCILKGQGNAMMFPNPLLRTPGDIDLWVRGKSIRDIIKTARLNNSCGKACYHHVDYGEFEGVEVELHYRPTFLNNLIKNRRLQKWIDQHEEEQFQHHVSLSDDGGLISVPTWEFNVVFQLSHIFRHVIQGGIGLKQIIDVYYLLKSNSGNTAKTYKILKYLDLVEIAGAVMWVLKEVFCMEEKYLITPVDERRGRFLLSEILQGGNFGLGLMSDKGWLSSDSAIGRNVLRLKRDVRLLRYFPSECLWEPVFRIYHFFWRMAYKL